MSASRPRTAAGNCRVPWPCLALRPKFEDPGVGFRLACTGAVRDEIMDLEELAAAYTGPARGPAPASSQPQTRA